VKLQLSPVSSRQDCYLLSETIVPSEEALISDNDVMLTSKNELSTRHVAAIVVVPVLVVVLVLLSILPAVVVIKAMRYCLKGRQPAQNEQGLREPLRVNGQRESEGTHNA
jgi:uncharacterized protein YneF (UPF0154 family)